MPANNLASYGAKISIELIGDILYFPLWWYSRGLSGTVQGLINFLRDREKAMALSVWVKNLFRPMYGQQDIAGVLISIGMRAVQIFARGLAMLFYAAAAFLFLLFWLLLPLIVVYEIFFQVF